MDKLGLTNNTSGNKQIPLWNNPSFWHITILMVACSVFYCMDVIIDYAGWENMRWDIFYTVHDFHRVFFLIPVMYAAYAFRIKGVAVTSLLSLLIFLPRSLFVSPYPDPLLRPIIFVISMSIMGAFLSLLLNNITKRKELEKDLSQVQDVLLSKQTEEALRESEYKYKNLIDNIPDIIFTIDLEGKITFVSKRAKEILGYENEETINRNIFDFIPEEAHESTMEKLRNGMEGEKIKHVQLPVTAKSGKELFFDFSFSRIYKDGTVIGAQGTAVDITDRKRVEEQLREASVYARNLIEASLDPLVTISPNGKIMDVNKATVEVTGVGPSELIGSDFSDYFTEPEKAKAGYRKVLADGLVVDYSLTLRHTSGKTTDVLYNAVVYRNEKGEIQGIFASARDITERKNAEIQLKEREVQYRTLADTGLALIWTSGTDKLCNYFNQPWLNFTGCTLEQEIGNGWTQGVHPDDFDRCLKIYVTAFDKRQAFDMEYRLRNAHGEYRWIRDLGTPNYSSSGEFIGYIGHCFDITVQREAEQEIRKLNKNLEQEIDKRTAKLKETIAQLEELNRAFVDRELKMIELKERIAELEKQKT